ncbi:hypothetical protein AVEN_104423-1 [Araneus ventricosus]|uniref:Uncharacterized protein n=1 Tax=Araneus ventricosus TaxID=182803 RepID=A0A4Y2HWW5_ARAVE|nr:hypothetical protein AVEN_104423-1 [Araneus ventricosus]
MKRVLEKLFHWYEKCLSLLGVYEKKREGSDLPIFRAEDTGRNNADAKETYLNTGFNLPPVLTVTTTSMKRVLEKLFHWYEKCLSLLGVYEKKRERSDLPFFRTEDTDRNNAEAKETYLNTGFNLPPVLTVVTNSMN